MGRIVSLRDGIQAVTLAGGASAAAREAAAAGGGAALLLVRAGAGDAQPIAMAASTHPSRPTRTYRMRPPAGGLRLDYNRGPRGAAPAPAQGRARSSTRPGSGEATLNEVLRH